VPELEQPRNVSATSLESDPYAAELYEYRADSPYVVIDDTVRRWTQNVDAPHDDLMAHFLAAGRLVHETVAYQRGVTTVRTRVDEVLSARAGVCQDFAHVLIALARARGIPARYASGYIVGGSGPVLGAEASHAWVEAYLPPYGWIGFDPTNDRLVDDAFVLVAVGRDYGDVSPTRGVFRGTAIGTISVNVAIEAAGQQ
jgi:transglutaminase-like putative cysteine protease